MTESRLEEFRQLVFATEPLQEELRDLTDRKNFVTRLTDLGAAHGYHFTAADVDEAMRRISAAPGCDDHITPTSETFHDWMPIAFHWFETDHPVVEWCYMGSDRFTDSFFEDTVRRRMRVPFSRLVRHRTSIEFLGEVCMKSSVIEPTGFIFHMSRCGSTLVAQMLAGLSSNIVISEAPPVSSIIRAPVSGGERRRWLRWMINAFGRRRRNTDRNYFLKFDSWNILDLDLIRSAFPEVPWIFLYRNPVEVIVSHMRQRGLQMVPGGSMASLLPDVTLTQALEMPAEEYCAKILARFCNRAVENVSDKNALLVNYDQLPEAVTSIIAEHFGVNFSPNDMRQMNDLARFNAKTPQMNFEPDSDRKRTEASEAARRAAAIWLDPIYEQLENMRSNI